MGEGDLERLAELAKEHNLTGELSRLTDLGGSIDVPSLQEVIGAFVNEIFKQFEPFFPILKAIGWAIFAYFILLILFAFARFLRARKHTQLMKEMRDLLLEIRDRLPGKKAKKEKE